MSFLPPELEQPEIVGINNLPAHCTYFPFRNKSLALADTPAQSDYYLSLNGEWQFKWAKNPAARPLNFQDDTYDKTNALPGPGFLFYFSIHLRCHCAENEF